MAPLICAQSRSHHTGAKGKVISNEGIFLFVRVVFLKCKSSMVTTYNKMSQEILMKTLLEL